MYLSLAVVIQILVVHCTSDYNILSMFFKSLSFIYFDITIYIFIWIFNSNFPTMRLTCRSLLWTLLSYSFSSSHERPCTFLNFWNLLNWFFEYCRSTVSFLRALWHSTGGTCKKFQQQGQVSDPIIACHNWYDWSISGKCRYIWLAVVIQSNWSITVVCFKCLSLVNLVTWCFLIFLHFEMLHL